MTFKFKNQKSNFARNRKTSKTRIEGENTGKVKKREQQIKEREI